MAAMIAGRIRIPIVSLLFSRRVAAFVSPFHGKGRANREGQTGLPPRRKINYFDMVI
jgi:hypothetical protein